MYEYKQAFNCIVKQLLKKDEYPSSPSRNPGFAAQVLQHSHRKLTKIIAYML
jgi:hypothetical protein